MKNNQRVLGLTGGIGSGKSTAGRVFAGFGLPVFDSDRAAKAVYTTDLELRAAVIKAFGKEIFAAGELQRERLAKIVFADKTKLSLLNSLVHPAVGRAFESWCSAQKTNWVIKEAAILIESGGYKKCDLIATVQAPENIRLERVSERDGHPKEEIMKRMANQLSDEERAQFADFSLKNFGNHALIPQVLEVLAQIEKVA